MAILKRGKVTKEVHSPYEINSLLAQGFTEVGAEAETVAEDTPKATKKDTEKAATENDTDVTGSTTD